MESSETYDVVTDGHPPVYAAGKSEWFGGCTLRSEVVVSQHRSGSVSEDDAFEDKGAGHARAVDPVVGEFKGESGEGGAHDPLVHGRVVSPVVGGEVGEHESARGWERGIA